MSKPRRVCFSLLRESELNLCTLTYLKLKRTRFRNQEYVIHVFIKSRGVCSCVTSIYLCSSVVDEYTPRFWVDVSHTAKYILETSYEYTRGYPKIFPL